MTTTAAAGLALRVARPTQQLEAMVRFYEHGLGLTVLGSFINHGDFDGVMLGFVGAAWHLELTQHREPASTTAAHPTARDPDELLVLYVPDLAAWDATIARLRAFGAEQVPSFNPYWDVDGATFLDPDGHRVVLQQGAWPRG